MNTETETAMEPVDQASQTSVPPSCKGYQIQFRPDGQLYAAAGEIEMLSKGDMVMAQTDHGLEPATVRGAAPLLIRSIEEPPVASYKLVRKLNDDEIAKYRRLLEREKEAFDICRSYIAKHQLPMKLVRVERFFNGSKIIFYFTAENRVDFRELVKDLVQEFRTRVEMRQIGVRHETKLIGGLGCCGRELCCASYIKNFAPVSIKMAKEQDVPLNPSKISGICNRLLCCLTYEYETYHAVKKHMPRVGKTVLYEGRSHKVLSCDALQEKVTLAESDSPDKVKVLHRDQWRKIQSGSPKGPKGGKK